MRSNTLKQSDLMLRSERRERLEAWAASDQVGTRLWGRENKKTPRRTGALNAAKVLVKPYEPLGLISA
jgi:hypothetical protein